MAFKTGAEGTRDAKAIAPKGTYETIIESARMDATKNGVPYIMIRHFCRPDVQQEQWGGHNDFLWMVKTPSPDDNACEGFSAKRINHISEAVGFPAGTAFASVQDWCDALAGRAAQIVIDHEEYRGEMQARISWYNASAAAPYNPAPAAYSAQPPRPAPPRNPLPGRAPSAPAAQGFTPMDDSDVPF